MNGTVEMTWAPLAIGAVVAVGWFVLNRALFRDICSPFSLLLVAWVLPLFLQATNLSYLETPWTARGMVVVGWTTFAMAAVSIGAAWFMPGRERESGTAFAATASVLRNPAFLLLFGAFYLLTFAIYLYVEFLTNPSGIPLLAVLSGQGAPSAVHRWGKESALQAIIALLYVLTPLGYLAFRVNRGHLLRASLLLAALLFPVFGVLKLSRSDVFVSVVSIGVAAYYARRWTPAAGRSRALVIGLASGAGAVVALMYAMMSLRISSVAVQDLYAAFIGFRLEADVPLRGVAAAVYGYVALPFENLNRFLAFQDGTAWHPGISVVRPLLSMSGLGDVADEINAAVQYPPAVSAAAGSATFLTAVYAEGGWLGVALVPALYALLVNALYVRMRHAPSMTALLLYGCFLYPWLWLFFNNGFGVLSIYINAAFIVAVGLLTSEFRSARSTLPLEHPA